MIKKAKKFDLLFGALAIGESGRDAFEFQIYTDKFN